MLCNNAGVVSSEDGGSRKLWDIPDATWDWVLGVNFYGVLYGIQTFLPHMIEHGEPGHVVNTSSVGGIIAGSGAYSVSKHGVLSLSEGLHIDLRSVNSNVSVSVLCPGLVNTNLLTAERNRPDQFGGPSEPDPDEPSRVGSMDDAMNPSNVAELVWDADHQRQVLHPAAPPLGRHGARSVRAHPRSERANGAGLRRSGRKASGGRAGLGPIHN